MPPASPHRTALTSLAALEALKRDQLVKLAKHFDLKANGKNVDLIQRLLDHGKTTHAPQASDDEGVREWSVPQTARPEAAQDLVGQASPPSSPPFSPAVRPPSPLRRTASPRHSLREAYLDCEPTSTTATATAHHPVTGIPSAPTPLPNHPAFRQIYPSLSPNSLAGTPSRPRPSIAPSAFSAADSPAIRAVLTPRARASIPGSSFVFEDDAMDTEDEAEPAVAGQAARAPTPPPARVASPPAFEFGSPNPAQAAFTFGAAFVPVAPASNAVQSAATLLQARILADRLAAGGPADRPLVPITFTATLGRHKYATGKALGEKEEHFGGAHKRAFDRMESIAGHYAAKRSPAKAKRPAEDQDQDDGRKTHPAAGKAEVEAGRPVKRTKMASLASSKRSLAGALRQSGWASVPEGAKAGAKGMSARAKGEAALARSSAVLDDTQAREAAIKRRQLELAKARRKSGAAGLASARKERRRSVQIGPPAKAGNLASRFLAGAFNKIVGKARVPPVPVVRKAFAPVAATVSAAKPAPRLTTSKSTFALPTATSQAKVRAGSTAPSQAGSLISRAAKPKFDLEASLARPLSYVPKVGAGSAALVRSNSMLRMTTTTAGGSPNSTRRASTLSLAGRVGNPGLTKAVRLQGVAQVAEVDVLPDDEDTPVRELPGPVGGVAMEREAEVLPKMSGSFPSFKLARAPSTNALSAAPEALLTVKSAFCFGPDSGSASAASAAASLGSPIHSLASPRPVLGQHNFLPPSSPGLAAAVAAAGGPGRAADLTELPPKPALAPVGVKKKKAGTPGKAPAGRKVVSGASRGARDLKAKQTVGRAAEGLESRARKAVAARAGAAGAGPGAGAGGKGLRAGPKA